MAPITDISIATIDGSAFLINVGGDFADVALEEAGWLLHSGPDSTTVVAPPSDCAEEALHAALVGLGLGDGPVPGIACTGTPIDVDMGPAWRDHTRWGFEWVGECRFCGHRLSSAPTRSSDRSDAEWPTHDYWTGEARERGQIYMARLRPERA